MNSIFKKSNSLVRSAKLLRANVFSIPKFCFLNINKKPTTFSFETYKYSNFGHKNINIINFNKNFFSDKKDKQPEKKSDEDEKGKDKNKEQEKEEDKKSKPSEEEPKDENNENKDKDKDNKNKNKKDDDKSTLLKEFIDPEFIKNNILLYALIIGGTVLYFYYRNHPTQNIIDMQGLSSLLATRDLSNVEFFKDMETNEITAVFHKKSDASDPTMNIQNIQEFLRTFETMQLQMGFNVQNFVPVKFINQKYEKTGFNELFLIAFVIGGAAGTLYKRANLSYIKKIGLKGSGPFKKKPDSGSTDRGSRFKLNNYFDFKNSNAKEYGAEEKIDVKFKDVAGMEQAKKEIVEFVDFLKNPEKYKTLGAKIPKGALLVGPPGTGKTLLAKAVAGEAGVPFFATSGSDFVEMFVGVGASRVRDLFKKAKDKAPSILFIDEIDAVGKKRGAKFGGHDERDNTLNQLLVEMDGFGTDSNVIVLAATNRADILDPALLRPGRFDRQVEVALPDRKDREEIVKIYLKKVKLDKSKSIEEYAMRLSTLTPGFSGADLSNLVNEAAIISARENKEFVDSVSFEKASERIIAGLETKRLISKKEKKTVAYHEAGHAVIGWFLENSNPLVKVTIIPRSKGSLGFAQYIPDDLNLYTKEYLLDTICVLLGGRMSEEFFFNQITSGASDDLQKVSNIAYSIVTKYGMSDLGLRAYGGQDEEYMAKPFSPTTETKIDDEVKKIIDECAQKTRALISEHQEHIKKLAEALLEKETVDISDLIEILGQRPYPFGESLNDYLKEIENRKAEAKKRQEEEERKKQEELEAKAKAEAEAQAKALEQTEAEKTQTENANTENKPEEKKVNIDSQIKDENSKKSS